MLPENQKIPMVTTESLAKYVGGQVEIQCLPRFFLVRGEAEIIAVVGRTLRVQFKFACKADIPVESFYRPHEARNITLDLKGCDSYEVEEGLVAVLNDTTKELWAFYPLTHPRRVLADGRMYNAPF